MIRRGLLVFLAVIAPLSLTSCSDEKFDTVDVYPVTGKVIDANGKPVEGASVSLHSEQYPPEAREHPVATTDAQGVFKIRTYKPDDGAPEGDWKVAVNWKPPYTTQAFEPGGRFAGILPPKKYGDPNTSGLTVSVAEGDNTMDPIKIEGFDFVKAQGLLKRLSKKRGSELPEGFDER